MRPILAVEQLGESHGDVGSVTAGVSNGMEAEPEGNEEGRYDGSWK